jgi:hypothetical protein
MRCVAGIRPLPSNGYNLRFCASAIQSAFGDVVLHRDRLGGLHERPPGPQIPVGVGGARKLVQVVGPRRDDETLDVARRLGQIAVEAPVGPGVAAAATTQAAHYKRWEVPKDASGFTAD